MNEQEYITVQEALSTILNNVSVLPPETVSLIDGLGRILAESIIAADSLPPFSNSSMDGYAVRAADTSIASKESPVSLRVVGDIAAGYVLKTAVSPQTTARIMTGAPLPDGADAVIPVEDTNESWRSRDRPLPEVVKFYRSVKAGDYVRHPGEDIVAGTAVLQSSHQLRPQEIGVLASLGVNEVQVVRRPRVGILATGDELIDVYQPLQPGKIRNSNGFTQTAQVIALGAIPVPLGVAADTKKDVREKLQAGLDANVDLFISSAGVSLGAHDVVKAVLEEGGNTAFWRVRMRPGKPLAHGRYHGVPYLGLPGNPVSAMVSFERFARAAILKMGGHVRLKRPLIPIILQDDINSDGRESYIRAIVKRTENGYIGTTTGGQGSHMMTSLVKANALLIVPEGVKSITAGETLQAWMLDWPEHVF